MWILQWLRPQLWRKAVRAGWLRRYLRELSAGPELHRMGYLRIVLQSQLRRKTVRIRRLRRHLRQLSRQPYVPKWHLCVKLSAQLHWQELWSGWLWGYLRLMWLWRSLREFHLQERV